MIKLNRGKNPEFVLIDTWSPPKKTRMKKYKLRVRDYIYTIFAILIIFGLIGKIEQIFDKPIRYVAEDLQIKKVNAQNNTKDKIAPTPQEDRRIVKLRQYLTENNSPLAPYASYIVKESDENGIDWTLMVSIAGEESLYGKAIQPDSHNPFGLKDNGSIMVFKSWDESIKYEAELLNTYYRKHMLSGIQNVYCPSFECSDNWTKAVEQFAKNLLEKNKN